MLLVLHLNLAEGGGEPPVEVTGDPWYEGKTIYPLSSVDGLVEWVDYWPVALAASNPGRFDNDGSYPVVAVLSSTTGKVAWVDYIPVFVVSRSTPWSTDPDGFVPMQDVTA